MEGRREAEAAGPLPLGAVKAVVKAPGEGSA